MRRLAQYVAGLIVLALSGGLLSIALATHTSQTYDPPPETGTVQACVNPPATTTTVNQPAETSPSGHVVDPADPVVVVDPLEECRDVQYVHDPAPRPVPIEHPTTSTQPTTSTTPTTTTPAGGTQLTLTDAPFWRCSQPIASYAMQGLPLRLTMRYTRQIPEPAGSGAVQLGAGCVGDGTPATDIVLDIQGDGRQVGHGGDAIRIMNAHPGATDLQIEGRANCGPRYGGSHQDGVQVLGGTNITFRNFEIGDYENGVATCQGAGGAFFYSSDSTDVDVEGGRYIACNHGLLAGWPSPGANVTGASFRTGGAPVCVQRETFAVSQPCDIRAAWGGVAAFLTCERWNGTGWTPQPSLVVSNVALEGVDLTGDNEISEADEVPRG